MVTEQDFISLRDLIHFHEREATLKQISPASDEVENETVAEMHAGKVARARPHGKHARCEECCRSRRRHVIRKISPERRRPYDRKPERSLTRRNIRERSRMSVLNKGFRYLQDRIPDIKNAKRRIPKEKILRHAITYIQTLQAVLEEGAPMDPALAAHVRTAEGLSRDAVEWLHANAYGQDTSITDSQTEIAYTTSPIAVTVPCVIKQDVTSPSTDDVDILASFDSTLTPEQIQDISAEEQEAFARLLRDLPAPLPHDLHRENVLNDLSDYSSDVSSRRSSVSGFGDVSVYDTDVSMILSDSSGIVSDSGSMQGEEFFGHFIPEAELIKQDALKFPELDPWIGQ